MQVFSESDFIQGNIILKVATQLLNCDWSLVLTNQRNLVVMSISDLLNIIKNRLDIETIFIKSTGDFSLVLKW